MNDNLKSYVEAEHFIESMGDIYCVRDTCDGCPYKDECVSEEADLEVSQKTPIRTCIGTDKEEAFGEGTDRAYKIGLDSKELKNKEYDEYKNKRFYTDEGYLPESRFVIIKEVKYKDDPYIVYNQDDDKYYCVRQVCSECPHFNECKPKIRKEVRDYITVAFDLRSQEPRCNALVTREPKWEEIFQNASLREQPELYHIIHLIFKNSKYQVNTKEDRVYWEWLDEMFYKNQTEAYYTYILYSKVKKEPENKQAVKELDEQIEYLLSKYEEYVRNRGKNDK